MRDRSAPPDGDRSVLVATMSTIVPFSTAGPEHGPRQGGAEQATPAQRLMGDIAPKLAEAHR